jgi:hypothetical protein
VRGKYLATLEATGELGRSHQCPATSKRSGLQCRRRVRAWMVTCASHGANARARAATAGREWLAQRQ